MCLILIAWREDADDACLIAANRDEFHERPTAPASWWSDSPAILAGRDLSAGGTWLGVTRSGRFAALTNFRGGARGPRANLPSRGKLVTDFLQSNRTVAQELLHLQSMSNTYNGFNLLFSDGARLGVFESSVLHGRELGPGIYGLSNHVLDTPWPKVEVAKSRLRSALLGSNDNTEILELLRDASPAEDHELPQTGIGVEWEKLLSSAFIVSPSYGTRCSTVFRIDGHGQAAFDEWTWDSLGMQSAHCSFEFAVTATAPDERVKLSG